MFNKNKIKELINECKSLKNKCDCLTNQIDETNNAETIKQHYCSVCKHGVFNPRECNYICELDHQCKNFERNEN